jgi:hypothetical protein
MIMATTNIMLCKYMSITILSQISDCLFSTQRDLSVLGRVHDSWEAHRSYDLQGVQYYHIRTSTDLYWRLEGRLSYDFVLTSTADSMHMAHYMKVPPRTVFTCQVVASIWACFVQIAVMNWALGAIDGICTT